MRPGGAADAPRRSAYERAAGRQAAGVVGLPGPLLRLIAGPPLRRDGLTLDPGMQFLRRIQGLDPASQETSDPALGRTRIRRSSAIVAGPPLPLARVEAVSFAGPAGPLGARLYVPDAARAGPAPLLVFFHGGGWVVGDLDSHDAPCRFLAREAGVRVLSVDYRLAPEHPFPAPVEDCLAAFRWVMSDAGAARVGADRARVAVGGDSAGGNLATVVALLTARDGGPAPAFQLLVYPGVDFEADYPSETTFAETFFLTKAAMDGYRRHYLGPREAEGDRPRDPRASPFRAPLEDLARVAPAWLSTAGFDPLRDEGEAYAARLAAAGARVVLRRHEGLVHGWFNMVGLPGAARAALHETAAALRTGLGLSPAVPAGDPDAAVASGAAAPS